ncbi:hypothetical protein LWI28_013305 [Acer negundo]|uniref:Uncharacterized protein n=1 Tax=Acer negundo TaxID=4023 RepID=A0AAD5NVM5_ACENE|nr:hypothetical protein LWI28_013305 [Acer negundo]
MDSHHHRIPLPHLTDLVPFVESSSLPIDASTSPLVAEVVQSHHFHKLHPKGSREGSLGFAAEVKHNKPAKTVLVDQSREGSSSRRPHISDEDQFAAFSSDFYLFEDVGSSREL